MNVLEAAPELAEFQTHPTQLAVGSPGKVGELQLVFEQRGDRSILAHFFRRAPLIVQRALYWDEAMPHLPCVYIISNSGGILQGDRYHIEMNLRPHAQAHVTTQSATKIQEMDANFATQIQEIVLHEHAYLEYLSEPIIPHRNSRFLTHNRITIHPSATLLYSEILMPGRKYYRTGELFQYDLFSSTVCAHRPDGEHLFTEKFIIQPKHKDVRSCGIMGPFDMFGNVIVLTPKAKADDIFAQVPSVFDNDNDCVTGISRLPNDAGLIFKVLAMESHQVRAKIREFWSVVRFTVTGNQVPPNFAWR